MKSKLIVAFFLAAFLTKAQKSGETRKATLITANVAYQNNWGEISKRFGYNLGIGAGLGLKTKSNWVYSLEGSYMFGLRVNENTQILDDIAGQQGYIFNQVGNYAELNVLMRGFYVHLNAEKILPLVQVNPNSGPIIGFGAGYLMHWVRLNNVGNDAPQVLDAYEKGYDRLSGGFSLKESLGYLYLSKSEGVNLKLSFDLIQAFTTNYRGFNYDTGRPDTEQNLDLFYSIRLNWFLPIYQKGKNEYYIN